MRVFANTDEFTGAMGEHLGYSGWHEVTQEQVNLFAEATGDHQWIHVDRERAATGPFGTTIAHGYLTLALIPVLTKEIYRVDNVTMGINYGSDRIRYPAVVPVGSRIRVGTELLDVIESQPGTKYQLRTTVEIEGKDKPACVAETTVLLIP